MCLYFDPFENYKATQAILSRNKPIYAYKAMDCYSGRYKAPYREMYFYVDGLNVSSRTEVKFTEFEESSNEVNEGFHCYRKLIDAIDSEGLDLTYFRVRIDPKDIVAVGTFVSLPSIVCTKFTVNLKRPITNATVKRMIKRIYEKNRLLERI